MTYQILTCPNCGGRGCPTCQNTGKVRVSSEQLQKIKTLAQQLGQASPSPHSGNEKSAIPGMNSSPSTANLAGIIAFSILAILSGAAASSWYFLKSLKPFLFGLSTLLTLLGANFAWKHPFFQLQEPNDFLKAIKSK